MTNDSYLGSTKLNNSWSKDFGLKDGQTYIIGRIGDICIDSPTVSKRHAAIIIKNGRIYLRDLDSTNGTYLVNDDELVNFIEGYVKPNQPIVIGNVKCTVYSLLAFIGDNPALKNHAIISEDTTLLVIPT
ncbi:MAG: FHA domain-containing protein [Candidatus Dadabacteria bacterium]